MSGETVSEVNSDGGKKFLKRHYGIVAAFAVAVVFAIAGAVYVFLWVVANAQSTGIVPATFNLWSMANAVNFILNVIFWELILIGIPAAVMAAVGWQWWKRLPEDEKREYHFFLKRSRTSNAGGGISFLFFIAFCIKVYVDGNWNVPVSTWTLDYVAGSMVTILVWSAVIFGIPAAIAFIWWVNRERKNPG